MRGSGTCPAGCGTPVDATAIACPADWARLPADLRDAYEAAWTRRHHHPRGWRTEFVRVWWWLRTNPGWAATEAVNLSINRPGR